MTNEYKIATISDFLALTPDQRAICAVDLLAWASFTDHMMQENPGVFLPMEYMVWVDDGRIGEVSAATLLHPDTLEELAAVEFPASGAAQ